VAAVQAEFDRQVETLLERGYPGAGGMTGGEFREHVEPLRERLGDLPPADDARIPFVLVVTSDLVAADRAIRLVRRRDKAGFSALDGDELATFRPIGRVSLPAGLAYLIGDVDTGANTRNVTPDAALATIERRHRSPLTIEEGVALVTHHPEAVARNGGFSLLGSRCGDRRVTALWISEGRPKLGWCWAGNPHTWLGSASCGRRIGL
jgi:hypothetical protein